MWPNRPARSRQWFTLRWPHEVDAGQLLATLLSLNGYSTPRPREALVLVGVGQAGHVAHHLGIPAPRAAGARHQVEAAIPGLAAEPADGPPLLDVDRAWRCAISTRERPLDGRHPDAVSRSLLTALGSAHDDEKLVVRWVLGPVHRPAQPLPRHRGAGRWQDELLTGLTSKLDTKPPDVDPEARTAHAQKQGMAGWRATLHLGVQADGRGRQRELLGRLAGAVRVAQGPGTRIRFRPARPAAVSRRRLPLVRPLLVNVAELSGLAGWPIGPTEELPVSRVRGRLLPPARTVPSFGRVVAHGVYPSAERPYALSARDALQHLHVLGPTGTGKSTLLLNLICQDMAAGRSVVVIEPRGDLVADVLARVPDDRVDDVVVIDPTDSCPVGLNPLAADGTPAELRADHLLTIFKRLWADSWGPRTQDILTSGLLTLTATPGLSLVALPLLFTDEEFRRRLVARVHDPLALGTFWQWFEHLSDDERAAVLAPVMNKLRAFLLRERLRRVIGQAEPRFDLRDVYRTRKVVLVNLATGALGPESAALLGSLVVSQLWQTMLGRAAVRPERRHPVMVFIDEFQKYLHLPTDLADVLAQARGLGLGLTLAHQHLAQLTPTVQAAVLANARSRVLFATNHDDAHTLIRSEPRLRPADVVGLGRYEAYVSLLVDSQATPYASGRTLPPPPALRSGDEVLQRSRQQWGVPAEDIDAEIAALVAPVRGNDDSTSTGSPAGTGRELEATGEPEQL